MVTSDITQDRVAIEFIATQLAPRIARYCGDARIKIVGADETGVPAAWRQPNISYLGISDSDTVRELFRTADIMLCPIQNDFGMKFKVAQASAYGTPFLASPQTAKCVPYLPGLPQINLSDPDNAAAVVCRLIDNEPELELLSNFIRERHRAFASSQRNIWSRTLAGAEDSVSCSLHA